MRGRVVWLLAASLVLVSACERADSSRRNRDAGPRPVPTVLDAAPPFPERPATIPSCTSDYAPRPERDPSPMCYVPGGEFDVTALGWEPDPPYTHVVIDDFLIDEHEVTAEQFVKFLNDAGQEIPCEDLCREDIEPPLPIVHRDGRFEVRPGKANLPLWHISGAQLTAYCAWAGKEVPTFAQWDVAAYIEPGGERRRYPWGNEWKTGMMNCGEDCADGFPEVAPPGSLHDLSPYGVMDMLGNVLEAVRGCADRRCTDVGYTAGTAWGLSRETGGFQPVPGFRGARCTRAR